MEDSHNGGSLLFGLQNQIDHGLAVLGIQAGGGLIQQYYGIVHDEAPRDIHPLLLAAAEGGRGQLKKPLRYAQMSQQGRGLFGGRPGGPR